MTNKGFAGFPSTPNAVPDALPGDTRFGHVIASQYYCPNADTSLSTTSSSNADVDATNAAVTFTVPASGVVWVRASFMVNVGINTPMDVTLREGGAALSLTSTRVAFAGGGSATWQGRVHVEWKVTGLIPGASKTYKLGFQRSSGAATCEIRTGTLGGPLTMIVYELYV